MTRWGKMGAVQPCYLNGDLQSAVRAEKTRHGSTAEKERQISGAGPKANWGGNLRGRASGSQTGASIEIPSTWPLRCALRRRHAVS